MPLVMESRLTAERTCMEPGVRPESTQAALAALEAMHFPSLDISMETQLSPGDMEWMTLKAACYAESLHS